MNRSTGLRAALLGAATSLFILPVAHAQFGAPAVTVPGTEQPPGPWPSRVSGANIDVNTIPDSILGGDRSNTLKVQVPESGPYKWSESRHNEGDLAIVLSLHDDATQPPNDYVDNYAITSGPTTHGWRINQNFGIGLATTRVNGRDNLDTFGGTPVGTVYGVTAFKNGFSQGQSYNMLTGAYGNGGDGAQDLQMSLAGINTRASDGEGSYSVAGAFFPFIQGWVGAHINNTTVGGGEVTFPGDAFSPVLTTAAVTWIADPISSAFNGHARVVLPKGNPDGGMLFGCATFDNNNGRIFGAHPREGGWDITVRDAENIDSSGTVLTPGNQASFCFVYVPWTSPELIGGYISGFGDSIQSAGTFTLDRTSPGNYELTIPGKTGSDGMLILTVAGLMDGSADLADRTFLSYEYVGGKFVVQSREVTAGADRFGLDYPLRDSDFVFAWVDFTDPLSPPYQQGPAPVVPVGEEAPGPFPNMTVSGGNLDVNTIPDSVLGGNLSNSLKVQVPESGPYKWSESRHNEGDLAIVLSLHDNATQPPNDYVDNYAVTTGPTTHGWRINQNFGIGLATTRVNGRDNLDTFGGTPVGTVYGVTAFKNGFSQGQSYNMLTGAYGNGGDGAQDLQMSLAGINTRASDGEGSYSVSGAFFPFAQGWIGAHVNNTTVAGGEVTFPGDAFSPTVKTNVVTWVQNPVTIAFEGHARVVLRGVEYTPDHGMLFGCATFDNNNGRIFGAAPREGGWDITVRDAENIDASGTVLTPGNQASFCFLFVPYTSPGLIGGHISSFGDKIQSAGNFTLNRTAAGTYELSIPGKTGSDGMLILTVAGQMEGSADLADRTFLSYEYTGGKFVIQSREVTGGADRFGLDYPLRDADFVFAWVDFTAPVAPPPLFTPSKPSLTIAIVGANFELSWPTTVPPYTLQSATTLSPANWGPSGLTPVDVGGVSHVTIPVVNVGNRYFRLAK